MHVARKDLEGLTWAGATAFTDSLSDEEKKACADPGHGKRSTLIDRFKHYKTISSVYDPTKERPKDTSSTIACAGRDIRRISRALWYLNIYFNEGGLGRGKYPDLKDSLGLGEGAKEGADTPDGFFSLHGVKISFETVDGTPIPANLAAGLNFDVVPEKEVSKTLDRSKAAKAVRAELPKKEPVEKVPRKDHRPKAVVAEIAIRKEARASAKKEKEDAKAAKLAEAQAILDAAAEKKAAEEKKEAALAKRRATRTAKKVAA